MGKWAIGVSLFGGAPERAEVEAETVAEAAQLGLEELGFEGNDEGSYQITLEPTE